MRRKEVCFVRQRVNKSFDNVRVTTGIQIKKYEYTKMRTKIHCWIQPSGKF